MQHNYAQIKFNQQGTPIAESFDDVYFSKDDGLAESNYVFLQNNQLPDRWHESSANTFVIAETGFGSGLNFLVASQAFLDFKQHAPSNNRLTLHYISIEKFPMRREDALATLAPFSGLSLCANLLQQWPINTEGCHRLFFRTRQTDITLDLWIGDVLEQLPLIQTNKNGLVDAWFLDGFAPSKNPEMWQQALFEEMCRLSRKKATFATFTAAGFVKRGLQSAGFNVEKRKGFGRKRDMLAGTITEQNAYENGTLARNKTPFYNRDPNRVIAKQTKTPHVIIAGGGIAAANLCYVLAKRGVRSTLLVKDQQVAQGASGNPQGGFYPQLNAQASVISQIQLNSFLFAKRTYQQVLAAGYEFSHQWCGVVLIGFSEEVRKRQSKMIESGIWPEHVIKSVSPEQATKYAGVELPYPGMYVAQGGWLSPPELVTALIKAASQLTNVTVKTDSQLVAYQSDQHEGITVTTQSLQHPTRPQDAISADALVVATGHHTNDLVGFADIPTALTRGQVESLPPQPSLSHLKAVLCHKGYLTPAIHGRHALGSTYVKNVTETEYKDAEQDKNLAMHARSLQACEWAQNLEAENNGRAAVRCSTPDHLPLVGALPDLAHQQIQYKNYGGKRPQTLPQGPQNVENVYMLAGLGSRGLTTGPMMAEVLACQLLGEPMPLANKLLDALSPNRFLLRALKRG